MDAGRDVLCGSSSSPLHVYRFLETLIEVEDVANIPRSAARTAIGRQPGVHLRASLLEERWTE